MTALALAFLAGVLTTGNPCVLPLLPLVLAGTLSGGRFGPLAFAAGLVLSFTTLGVGVVAVGYGLGLTPEILRTASAVLLGAFGVVLLVPKLQDRFALATAGVANGAQALSGRVGGSGPGPAFLIGALSGALWSPCAGPSLGAAIALAAEAGGAGAAAARLGAYALGAASVLVLLAYGSQAVIRQRRDAMLAASTRLKPVMGALLVAAAVLILSGLDKRVEAAIVSITPEWLSAVTTGF